MLHVALKAELPLIVVRTDDVVNIGDSLMALSGKEFKQIRGEDGAISSIFKPHNFGKCFYTIEPEELIWHNLYQECVRTNVTLVVVNPTGTSEVPFDAGWLGTSQKQVYQLLSEIAMEEDVPVLANALSGISLKEIGELVQISIAEYGELTVDHLLHLRRMLNRNTKGLTEIDTESPAYVPNKSLKDWIALDGQLLLNEGTPSELVPRGLLFDGPPGTGKTEGAKFIAHSLGLPLYRLDLGALMNKYVGESEGNLDRLLTIVDKSDPCILLLDEVEKIFKTTDDSGVTSRLLSQLLWWLQEHRSRVVTIMTTNDSDALPAELVRPGRIDSKITFEGLHKDSALKFLKAVYNGSLYQKVGVEVPDTELSKVIAGIYYQPDIGGGDGYIVRVAHSKVVQGLYTYLKSIVMKEQTHGE